MASFPDARGRFGAFGGRYVPETLIPALDELAREYEKARRDPKFKTELDYYLREYVGRPTPLYHAERLSKKLGGAKIYFKREDLSTPARTRSTIRSVRRSWPAAWGRNG